MQSIRDHSTDSCYLIAWLCSCKVDIYLLFVFFLVCFWFCLRPWQFGKKKKKKFLMFFRVKVTVNWDYISSWRYIWTVLGNPVRYVLSITKGSNFTTLFFFFFLFVYAVGMKTDKLRVFFLRIQYVIFIYKNLHFWHTVVKVF